MVSSVGRSLSSDSCPAAPLGFWLLAFRFPGHACRKLEGRWVGTQGRGSFALFVSKVAGLAARRFFIQFSEATWAQLNCGPSCRVWCAEGEA